MTLPRLRRAALLMALALPMIGLGACAAEDTKGSVTVLAPWTGAEREAFKRVLDEFSDRTGIRVGYQDTRALPQVLLAKLQAQTPPDVAVTSSVGELAKYARGGKVYPLDGVLGDKERAAFKRPWLLPLQKGPVEHIYTVPLKVNVKSIIWYSPSRAPTPLPDTWDKLTAYTTAAAQSGTTPWCMGMGDAPSSGWPGTDMIEDIFLHKYPEEYRQWAAGEWVWASDEVRDAWRTWGEVYVKHVYGGPRATLSTDFKDAGRPLFADKPGCFLEHQASFITGFYQEYKDLPGGPPRPGTDFEFFPFPPFGDRAGDLWLASVDLAAMFNDTPQARALMRFLATKDAQRLWPARSGPGAGAIMANKDVERSVYGDGISRRLADIVGSDRPPCFDAADVMPPAMRNAFYRAVLEYVSDPGRLDELLRQLDHIRTEMPREDWLDFPCADAGAPQ